MIPRLLFHYLCSPHVTDGSKLCTMELMLWASISRLVSFLVNENVEWRFKLSRYILCPVERPN